jgi:hypothetical protein
MGKKGQIIGISVVADMFIGIVVGAVTDNMGFWIATGTVIGLLIGAVLATRAAEENGDSQLDNLPNNTSEE